MKVIKPRICFLICTYNRSEKVVRAIESVLKQTYKDFELVLINNGSTDQTKEVLEKYRQHKKIRIIHLEKNIGSIAGLNFAFDQINGEWFGSIGDDDFLMDNAFEEAMKVVDEMDTTINAITANAISTATREFAGIGLDKDQYLTIETIIKETTGDFFGLTKTELLGDLRLIEDLTGDANTLWYKIDAKANRFYIHKALMVYNTIEGKTETTEHSSMNLDVRVKRYSILLKEPEYWRVIKKYNVSQFRARCIRGVFIMKSASKKREFKIYKSMLNDSTPSCKDKVLLLVISITPEWFLKSIYNFAGHNKLAYSIVRLFFKKYSFFRSK
jgi:glycosyltransferase involved in cell wall biosynthesis